MARFQNFRRRARRSFNNFRTRTRGFRSRSRRAYNSKTLGMKTSTLIKLAIVGVVGFMFKDKLKPLFDSIFNKKA